MQPGQRVYDEVVRGFGREILNPDGTINRPRLAEAAFGSPGGVPPRVQELNDTVHPAVIEYENHWMKEIGRRDPNAIAIVEAALIENIQRSDLNAIEKAQGCHGQWRRVLEPGILRTYPSIRTENLRQLEIAQETPSMARAQAGSTLNPVPVRDDR